jgi:uncharacterized protein (DUF433 family)
MNLRNGEKVDHLANAINRFILLQDYLREELAPESGVLADILLHRLVLSVQHLEEMNTVDHCRIYAVSSRVGGPPTEKAQRGPSFRTSPDTLLAQRELQQTLDLLRTYRDLRQAGKEGPAPVAPDRPTHAQPTRGEADEPDPSCVSNEWPFVPASELTGRGDDLDAADSVGPAERWEDRLVFDFDVSETSPVVKGTWITAGRVVSLIVDGSTWADILRAHPELTEEDIRVCLAYTIEQDNEGSSL